MVPAPLPPTSLPPLQRHPRPPRPADTHRRRLPRGLLLPPARGRHRLRVQYLPEHLLQRAGGRRVSDVRDGVEVG